MTPQMRRTLTYGGTAIAILVVAGVGAVAYRALNPPPQQEVSVSADLVNPQAQKHTAPQAAVPGAVTPAPESAGEELSGAATPQRPPASDKSVPSFDVVRVEPNGESVVAGRAPPDSTVELLSNGKVTTTVKADSAGQFVMIPGALKPGDHQLTLRVTEPGGHSTKSNQAVVVSVPKKPGGQLLVVAEEPGRPARILSAGTPAQRGAKIAAAIPTSPAATPAPGGAPDRSDASAAAGSSATTSAEAIPGPATPQAAPATPAAAPPAEHGPTGQGRAAPEPAGAVKPHVDAVEAEAGHLFVQGSGEPGAHLDIYLNNAPIAGAKVGPDGRWSLTVRNGLTAGDYQVRVDQVGPDGKVVARAAVPFTYAPQTAAAIRPPQQAVPAAGVAAAAEKSGAASAAAPGMAVPQSVGDGAAAPAPVSNPDSGAGTASGGAGGITAAALDKGGNAANPVVESIGTVTIVRGDNLWTISRHVYGHGIRYTVIYAANEDQIRDPDLIYPGQIFVLPPANIPMPNNAPRSRPG